MSHYVTCKSESGIVRIHKFEKDGFLPNVRYRDPVGVTYFDGDAEAVTTDIRIKPTFPSVYII